MEVDENLIRQVIYNITMNAREAMEEKGNLTITAKNCRIAKENALSLGEGNYIKISIKDDGSGIEKENITKIFDPYFTTKSEGAGLGLALSYSIIRKHGGQIIAESKPEQGAVFTIFLPASGTKVKTSKVKIPEEKRSEGRILVMDDDEMILRILARMIERFGLEVATTTNGEEAIVRYKKAAEEKKPFNIVIMDLTIPGGLGGKETIRILKEYDPDIKAIVSSGFSNDPIMANYCEYGFQGVVEKPYKMEDLKTILFDLLQR